MAKETEATTTETVEKTDGAVVGTLKKHGKKIALAGLGVLGLGLAYLGGYLKGSKSELYLEAGSDDSIDIELNEDGSYTVSNVTND